jgi:hypothetical protein
VRSKDIGTEAETKVVRYLLDHGFPAAERRALHGTQDLGDITGTPGLVFEVKAGKAAHNASDNQVDLWLAETELERDNAGEDVGVLVVARYLKNVRSWWAFLPAEDFTRLALRSGSDLPMHDVFRRMPVRLPLQDVAHLLRVAGYGIALAPDAA